MPCKGKRKPGKPPPGFVPFRTVNQVVRDQQAMLSAEAKKERMREKAANAAQWFKQQPPLKGGFTDFKFPMPGPVPYRIKKR